LLHLLDSAIVQTKIERHRHLATDIRAKITRLLRGFEPPGFELFNQDSVLVSLQQYRGKYVYLMFCTTQNYVCLSQYELLEKLYRDHHKWLQIVVVSADERLSDMRGFCRKNDYRWDFLHFANTPDVLKNYDVRIFPTCYLIDPEGKLVLSPAPAANDQLERTLWLELNGKGLWQEYIRKGWIEIRR
jgi:peroxiredoxin